MLSFMLIYIVTSVEHQGVRMNGFLQQTGFVVSPGGEAEPLHRIVPIPPLSRRPVRVVRAAFVVTPGGETEEMLVERH